MLLNGSRKGLLLLLLLLGRRGARSGRQRRRLAASHANLRVCQRSISLLLLLLWRLVWLVHGDGGGSGRGGSGLDRVGQLSGGGGQCSSLRVVVVVVVVVVP
ncbi:hypothetical protein DFJ77DRAFT_458615 [Powellomyces hirtus]|nr:hypothetical protein DFJ77DRAFT_458615 [Powellomyces hirtus]